MSSRCRIDTRMKCFMKRLILLSTRLLEPASVGEAGRQKGGGARTALGGPREHERHNSDGRSRRAGATSSCAEWTNLSSGRNATRAEAPAAPLTKRASRLAPGSRLLRTNKRRPTCHPPRARLPLRLRSSALRLPARSQVVHSGCLARLNGDASFHPERSAWPGWFVRMLPAVLAADWSGVPPLWWTLVG
jgi:hypothetical protein